MNKFYILIFTLFFSGNLFAQNPLFIPPTLSGTNFNLTIQNGTTQFYNGINTPTYGINGNLLAPTLIMNKWDSVTLNVTNTLTGNGNSTTIHWHGLHVPAMADGGPHQVIAQGSTWSPQFRILNSAGTFWYHPHGDKKTDLHVSKGIAGMIIVRDSVEGNINLPRNYGIDDFPIIVQSKAFDVLNQIAISTEMDTAVFVNGTVHAYLNAPSQVIRMRLLNGSSMRTYNFGFTNNMPFKMIAGDAGLLDNSVTLTRIRLSPGERAEILLDLQGMNGQSIYLNSFSSEMQNGIYGAATVNGMGGATIPDYDLNPLNGADFGILQINVGAQTSNPVTTTPNALATNNPWSAFTVSRTFTLAPVTMGPTNMLIGPFDINGAVFDMNTVNVTTYLNSTEKWRITNNTSLAHPFHIHDMHFYLLNINGAAVPDYEAGKKDVVLVLPNQYVEFITKFEDFADEMVPYMYHCHLLHHEDDGMMGSFLVLDPNASIPSELEPNHQLNIYPNPVESKLNLIFKSSENYSVQIFNSLGELLISINQNNNNSGNFQLETSQLAAGIYFLQIKTNSELLTQKFIKK